jgi:hypothetical protein
MRGLNKADNLALRVTDRDVVGTVPDERLALAFVYKMWNTAPQLLRPVCKPFKYTRFGASVSVLNWHAFMCCARQQHLALDLRNVLRPRPLSFCGSFLSFFFDFNPYDVACNGLQSGGDIVLQSACGDNVGMLGSPWAV